MEVKNILKKITHQEEEKKKLYFAFEITQELVKTAVWTISSGEIQVLSFGATKEATEETLLEALDSSISSAIAGLPPELQEIEPSQVIFGLPPSWVEEDKIIVTKTPLLKNIVEQFDLAPMGFVVIPEAIIHFLKNNEGLPPTAVLVGLEKETATITLVSLGKILGSQVVRRSGNLGGDLIEGLSRLDINEPYPSRIILYTGQDDLEVAKQELTVFPFQEANINFLHLPKVESLATETDIQAVALAGGQEYAKNTGVETAEGYYTEEVVEETEPPDQEVMGFVQDRDIALDSPLPEPELVPPVPIPPMKKKLRLPSISLRALPSFGMPAPKKMLVVILVLALTGSGVFGMLWFLPHAQVTLFVAPQALEKNLEIKIDPTQSAVNEEEFILPGEKVETSLSAEKSYPTTGSKKVGEQSRGEVTIFNGTVKEKTFTGGTEIISSSGHKFTFDESATVASQSGTAASPTPGRATAKITAVQIGAEENLAADTEFAIGNFAKSDYVAKNSNALAGGSSREVQVVAKEDQEKLLSSLTDELSGQAIDQLNGKLPPGRKIIPDSITKKVLTKEFDAEVGKETTEIKGKLEMGFSALSYTETDLDNLVRKEVEKTVPDGYEYHPGENDATFSFKDLSKESVATFVLKIKTTLSPKVQAETVRQTLRGKSIETGRKYLETLANVSSFEAKITPKLPAPLVSFPRILKNITVIIEVK